MRSERSSGGIVSRCPTKISVICDSSSWRDFNLLFTIPRRFRLSTQYANYHRSSLPFRAARLSARHFAGNNWRTLAIPKKESGEFNAKVVAREVAVVDRYSWIVARILQLSRLTSLMTFRNSQAIKSAASNARNFPLGSKIGQGKPRASARSVNLPLSLVPSS